ncbi:hypothetical protein DAI22_01g164950 [Oryza sativa Japonica Group]|nr:hypothetical protein DAI22_01g164950 [Oryza sativa Japonica Group]
MESAIRWQEAARGRDVLRRMSRTVGRWIWPEGQTIRVPSWDATPPRHRPPPPRPAPPHPPPPCPPPPHHPTIASTISSLGAAAINPAAATVSKSHSPCSHRRGLAPVAISRAA